MKRWTRTIRTLAALLAVVAGATSVCAQGRGNGGGNGGGGSGTIYYVGPWAGVTTYGTAIMTSMDPDGSNKTELGYMFGPPSTALHGGHRWFTLTQPIPDAYYPDGTQRAEVFVLRDDYDGNNTAVTRVQVTDDPTLQPEGLSTNWVPGDLMISFKGRRWSSTDPGATIVEGGLYVVPLAFAPDGNITGSVALPTSPILAFPLGTNGVAQFPGRDYGWNPEGTHVVYIGVSSSTTGLWIADVLTGARARIYEGYANDPQFSPDGAKIVFSSLGQNISTIRVNGAGLKRVISSTSAWVFYKPYYSPDGSTIVCAGQSRERGPSGWLNIDVFRVQANGNSLTNLTNTPDPLHEWPWGWR